MKNPMHELGLLVVIAPASRGIGYYEARLGEKGRKLCKSTQPLLDSARSLLASGFDPSFTLVMCHAGSRMVCLSAPIGVAAALTVEETKFGPRFRPRKTISTPAGQSRIAPNRKGRYQGGGPVTYSNGEVRP